MVTQVVSIIAESALGQCCIRLAIFKKRKRWEFSGGPVVRTVRFHCWGPEFNPWSGRAKILQTTKHGQINKRERGQWKTWVSSFHRATFPVSSYPWLKIQKKVCSFVYHHFDIFFNVHFCFPGWQWWWKHRKLPLFPEALHDSLAQRSCV